MILKYNAAVMLVMFNLFHWYSVLAISDAIAMHSRLDTIDIN